MAHINVFDSLFFTPIMLSDFYFFCIPAYILRMSCVCPVYVLCMSGVHPTCTRRAVRSTSSVKSYLRSNLTADSRTSPVPAIFHFYSLFYYFHLQMFERFMNCIVPFHIVCRLRYTSSYTQSCIHPAFILHSSCTHPVLILHSSCIHPFCILVCILCVCPVYVLSMSCLCPVYIRRAPDVQSFLSSSVKSYLRSNLTADSRTNLVPAIFHFFILFITFIYRCSRDL